MRHTFKYFRNHLYRRPYPCSSSTAGKLKKTAGKQLRAFAETKREQWRGLSSVGYTYFSSKRHYLQDQKALTAVSRLLSIFGSIEFSDHWHWQSDCLILAGFDTNSQFLLKPSTIPLHPSWETLLPTSQEHVPAIQGMMYWWVMGSAGTATKKNTEADSGIPVDRFNTHPERLHLFLPKSVT